MLNICVSLFFERNSKLKHDFISIQPYGFINGAEDTSTGAEGSRRRVDKALELLKTGVIPQDSMVIFPQKHGLGKQLWEYFKPQQQTPFSTSVYLSEISWGTFDDILATYRIIASLLESISADDEVHLHFITDPDHLKRVKMIVGSTCPSHWKAHYHPATRHQRSWFDRKVYELLARWKVRVRLIFRRIL